MNHLRHMRETIREVTRFRETIASLKIWGHVMGRDKLNGGVYYPVRDASRTVGTPAAVYVSFIKR